MTKRELIQALEAMPVSDHTVVKVTWEGITRNLTAEHVYLTADGILLIDGDENHYKEAFVAGRKLATRDTDIDPYTEEEPE